MATVFLMGGVGNQLFQYVSSDEKDRFCTLFLNNGVRRLLGWTQHEKVLRYPQSSLPSQILACLVLFIDLFLAKLVGRTLFSRLNTMKMETEPLFFEYVRFGYFIGSSERRSLDPIMPQIASVEEEGLIAVHVRGGDFLPVEDLCGRLDRDYYCKGVTMGYESLVAKGCMDIRVLVLTDDPHYAATLNIAVKGLPAPEIKLIPLDAMLARSVGADWFVSSNSTLSYWIIRLRKGVGSVAPQPFQRICDFSFPQEAAHRLPVDYGQGAL